MSNTYLARQSNFWLAPVVQKVWSAAINLWTATPRPGFKNSVILLVSCLIFLFNSTDRLTFIKEKSVELPRSWCGSRSSIQYKHLQLFSPTQLPTLIPTWTVPLGIPPQYSPICATLWMLVSVLPWFESINPSNRVAIRVAIVACVAGRILVPGVLFLASKTRGKIPPVTFLMSFECHPLL